MQLLYLPIKVDNQYLFSRLRKTTQNSVFCFSCSSLAHLGEQRGNSICNSAKHFQNTKSIPGKPYDGFTR